MSMGTEAVLDSDWLSSPGESGLLLTRLSRPQSVRILSAWVVQRGSSWFSVKGADKEEMETYSVLWLIVVQRNGSKRQPRRKT